MVCSQVGGGGDSDVMGVWGAGCSLFGEGEAERERGRRERYCIYMRKYDELHLSRMLLRLSF